MWAQADGDKEPQKEEDKGLNPLKKMLASFDDADSGQGNSPMERAGKERVVQCVNAASLNNKQTQSNRITEYTQSDTATRSGAEILHWIVPSESRKPHLHGHIFFVFAPPTAISLLYTIFREHLA